MEREGNIDVLANIITTRAVIVRGDRTAAYDKVLDAMVLLQKAGVERVGLETKHIEDQA